MGNGNSTRPFVADLPLYIEPCVIAAVLECRILLLM